MFGKSLKGRVAVLAVSTAIAAMASAGVAQAAAPPLPYCQASSVRVDMKVLLSWVSLNPFQVGGGQTCSAQYQRIVGLAAGAITAQGLVNETSVNGTAHSRVALAIVNVPGLFVVANALDTAASRFCSEGSSFATWSQVGQLTVNGYPITVPKNNASGVVLLPLGVRVYLNRVQQTEAGVTVTAVSIATPLANVNIAESRLTGSPCSFGLPSYSYDSYTPPS